MQPDAMILDSPVDQIARCLSRVTGPIGSADADAIEAPEILAAAARFAREVIAPLNADVDREGAALECGRVRLPPQMVKAYRQFCDSGWMSAPHNPVSGGQGLTLALQFALTEIWASASAAFNQIPALTQSCVPVLEIHGPEWMRETWIPRLVSGEWTGAMGMTEASAGSDLSLVTTHATSLGDGRYAIVGQKMFNSFGDHDAASNVISLVLARTPQAPAGLAGVSLFAVPFYSSGKQGQAGARNHVEVMSLERKLGFHASPTCLTRFGNDRGDGAEGFLIGPLHQGIASLFPMLNLTRIHSGMQGVGLAERARQFAQRHAEERVQGRPVAGGSHAVPIAQHPDVGRMLRHIRSIVAGGRALCLFAATQLDIAAQAVGAESRIQAARRAEILTPLAKSWCTAQSVEATLLAIQIYGGAGYIDDTGVSQFLKEAVVGPIYEGTNGIQALDFGRRKVARDEGRAMLSLASTLREEISPHDCEPTTALALKRLDAELAHLEATTRLVNGRWLGAPSDAATGASNFLDYVATLIVALLLARGGLAATQAHAQDVSDFTFFVFSILPRCAGLRSAIEDAPLHRLGGDLYQEQYHGRCRS